MSVEMEAIHMRITDMDKKVGEVKALIAMREVQTESMEKKIDKILDVVVGSGDLKKPSLTIQVDRLNQAFALIKWVAGTVVLLVIKAVVDYLKHG